MNHSFQWFQNHVCSFNSFLVFLSRIIVLLSNGIAATITGLAFLLAVCTCDHEAGTMRIQPPKHPKTGFSNGSDHEKRWFLFLILG